MAKISYKNWFSVDGAINSVQIYCALIKEIRTKVENEEEISDIITFIEHIVASQYKKMFGKLPTTGSLNNARGRWNEFIAAEIFCHCSEKLHQQNRQVLIFGIPNSRVNKSDNNELSSSFLKLFKAEEFQADLSVIEEFKEDIFIPSPDYIIVELLEIELFRRGKALLDKQRKDPSNQEIYEFFEGKIASSEIKAIVSLKTSNRPDRRYQPSFEAAVLKAIAYASNKDWKYFMVSTASSESDKILFEKIIAPHGIALSSRIRLIDGVFEFKYPQDLENVITAALSGS